MPSASPPFRFHLDRVPPGPGPAFRRLARALEGEIRARRAPSGTRLPSVRDLADRLKVHPSTVRAAYNLLETQGKVVSQVGRGT
ncbi:MAG TPA: GntR family transcriptional regulator, partial [Planctomycetes bacterium]|nr:GntR family transcriptional regulator [Planctomycetota bacterium]